jgi:Tfp pilus assembly protein FimV
MVNSRKLRLGALSAALLSATQGWAIGLGDIVLRSRVGEPLRAEVPINTEPGETIEASCFTLAPLDGSDLPVISAGRIKLVREGDRYRLLITGSKPVSEPVFLIGVRAGCGIDLQRDYVLMPPEPLVLASGVSAPAGDGVDTPSAGARGRGAGGQDWRASEGDTLESIAEALVPDNLAQQRRMLAALKRANPKLSGRPGLADGTLVTIPDVRQRLVAERDTLPEQRPPRARSEDVPPPPPPPPPPPKIAQPVAAPKTGGADRVLLGAPPAEIAPGQKAMPPKGSREEFDERMLKVQATIQSLNAQIEALDKALALTAEAMALQQKMQAAETATASLPAPVAKPAAPPPPAGGTWQEFLLSALAGGLIAAGLAHFLGRRHDRRAEREVPLAIASPARPAIPRPAPALSAEPAAAPAGATTGAASVDLHLDGFSRPPGDLRAVDVKYNQDDTAIALAEIMLSFGRLQGATETLARHIEDSASDNPRPWLMLLDLYRRGGLRGDYTKLLPVLRKKFNLQVPAWQDAEPPVLGLKSLEDYQHVITQLTTIWGTQDCLNYLYRLVHDNREGQRSGFPLEVVEEIVLLMLILESGYGLERIG